MKKIIIAIALVSSIISQTPHNAAPRPRPVYIVSGTVQTIKKTARVNATTATPLWHNFKQN